MMDSTFTVQKLLSYTFDLPISNDSFPVEVATSYNWPGEKLSRVVFTFFAVVLGWLGWRVWSFTVLPRLYPDRPQVYPYWFPWIGHSLNFVFNADRTLDQARQYFNNTRKPFTLVLGGQNVHMITSAKDTTAVFKNPEQLVFDTYIQDMMLRFGITKHGVDTTWHSSGPMSGKGSSNRSLFKILESTMKTQLNPGNQMLDLQAELLGRINEQLTWTQIPESCIRESRESEKVVSLLEWTQQCLLKSVTTAFYGEAIFKVEPDFLQIFSDFDDNGWKLPYRVPAFFSKNMLRPKERAQEAFRKYFELPKIERADACWMVHTLEAEMRAAGVQADDISTFLLMVYWGVNTNAWKAAFWMIASTVSNPTLKASIEEEIMPHTMVSPPLSPTELQNRLEKCPLLTATYNETLRFFTSSTAARDVISDCTIGGLVLEKGSRLVIPYRQMLLDEDVFGEDASKFNPERFIRNGSLARHPSFRPYGGGLAYCPGRFIAQKEITYFNAQILTKFQLELYDQNCTFPEKNTEKPCSGVVQVASGHDLLLRVKERTRKA